MRTFGISLFLAMPLILQLLAGVTAAKEPIPGANLQAEVDSQVKEIYESELHDAKTPEALSTLAKKFLDLANEGKSDATSCYVLLKMAGNLATRAGDAALAMQVVEEMDKQFEIDALQIKFLALQSMAAKTRNAEQSAAVLEYLIAVMDESAKRARFEQARKMLRMATAAARKARDMEAVKALNLRGGELEASQRAFSKVKEALAVLEKQPTDPAANLTVGRFRCFHMEQWEAGLSMLALGNDEELKKIAIAELGSPVAAKDLASLADDWWNLADQEKGTIQAVMRRRALDWYEKALPELSGLTKAKVSRRITEVKNAQAPERSESKKLEYALNFGGSQYVRSNLRYSGSCPMTLEAIVMPTSYEGSSSNKAVVGTYYYSGMGLMLCSSNRWGFLVKDTSARWSYSLAQAELNKMVHLAGVYNGPKMALFVDGKLQSSTTMQGPHKPSQQPIGVGAYPYPDNQAKEFFRGQIAAVRISAAVLYTEDFTPAFPFKARKDTVLLYHFEEGKGNRTEDASGNGNHGFIVGARWGKLNP